MSSERKFVEEKIRRVLLKESIVKVIERAGFGGIEIRRTPHGTRITLTVERPGLVIGRKGMTITKLTKDVEEKYHFENPQIEVKDSENPNVNAQIMAQKLASALERGWHFRRAGHSTVRRIMDGGAKGCMIVISGKLTGQRHRTEKFSRGHIKYCGDTALKWMDIGFAVAKKKLGVIGIKVMIMNPDAKLPDEVDIVDATPEEDDAMVELQAVEDEGEKKGIDDLEGEEILEILKDEEDVKKEEKEEKPEKAEKAPPKKKPKKTKKKAKKETKKEKTKKVKEEAVAVEPDETPEENKDETPKTGDEKKTEKNNKELPDEPAAVE